MNALQVIKPILAQNASANLDLGEDKEDVLNDVRIPTMTHNTT